MKLVLQSLTLVGISDAFVNTFAVTVFIFTIVCNRVHNCGPDADDDKYENGSDSIQNETYYVQHHEGYHLKWNGLENLSWSAI